MQRARKLDVKAFGHKVRFVFNLHGQAGTYFPVLNVFLSGPNGSPAGTGPKSWPQPLARRFHPGRFYARRYLASPPPRWTSSLTFVVPHLSWTRAYRVPAWLRPVALKLYQADYRLNRWITGGHLVPNR